MPAHQQHDGHPVGVEQRAGDAHTRGGGRGGGRRGRLAVAAGGGAVAGLRIRSDRTGGDSRAARPAGRAGRHRYRRRCRDTPRARDDRVAVPGGRETHGLADRPRCAHPSGRRRQARRAVAPHQDWPAALRGATGDAVIAVGAGRRRSPAGRHPHPVAAPARPDRPLSADVAAGRSRARPGRRADGAAPAHIDVGRRAFRPGFGGLQPVRTETARRGVSETVVARRRIHRTGRAGRAHADPHTGRGILDDYVHRCLRSGTGVTPDVGR